MKNSQNSEVYTCNITINRVIKKDDNEKERTEKMACK